MELKHRSKLESSIGRYWMYRGTAYHFNDFQEIGERIIISTDIKALNISAADVEGFLKELLPADAPAKTTGSPVILSQIPGMDGGVFQEITNGLLTSFREIQGSKDERFLKEATARARAKIGLSKAVTDIAKTVVMAHKAAKGSK